VRERTRRIEGVCERWGVPLIAAALQYPLRHPAVACVIPGAKNEAEVASNVALMNIPIPEGLWKELENEGLLP
jgi:D-threo-aldose 1-dehydrogenase